MPIKLEHVHCSRCGTRCSGVDPELGLVVRAYVLCVACLDIDAAATDPRTYRACINCDVVFESLEVRHYFGAHDVGPFCARCDQIIKTHTGFQEHRDGHLD